MRRYYWVLFVILATGACSKSIDREQLRQKTQMPPAKGWSDSGKRSTSPIKRSSLRLPMTIAVHISPPENDDWRLTAYDRGKIAGWAKRLQRERIVDSLLLMSSLVSTGNSLAEIRQAAQRHGASTVLVLQGEGQQRESWNPLALTYLTILGYYIFPGSHAESVFVLRGALLDVQTGKSLLEIETEGKDSRFAPGAWLDSHNNRRTAQKRAVRRFGKKFDAQINALVKTTPKAAPKRKTPQANLPPVLR